MKYVKPLYEKKPKGAPDFHHSDAPDAEGRFKDLSIKDLAAWLIKTRKGDVKKISGSLTQQIVFNRNDDPKYAEKMEKTRREVYKQLDRQDLLDKMDESLVVERKWSGEEVWDHIVSITPEEDDIPWGFEDDVTSKDFKMTKIDLKKLLKTDSDLAAYYKGGEQRYHSDDVSEYDLDFEIVVIDGELIDGYSRVSALLRNGERYAHGFVSEKVNMDRIEDYADDILDPTDVEFTKHFFDRLTRAEHDKDITDAELIGFFKRLAKKKKQFDKFMKQYDEFIVKDKRTDLNIPFVKRVNQIIAKTIMRKKDFISSNPAYTFEQYAGNMDEFKYEFPNRFEDITGFSTKAIKKISRKGKTGFKVLAANYMNRETMAAIGDAMGLDVVGFEKKGRFVETIYEEYTFIGEELQMINEIGDASAKVFKYKPVGNTIKKVLGSFDSKVKTNSKGNGGMDAEFTWEFTNDDGVKYVCKLNGGIHQESMLQLSFGGEPKKEPKYKRYVVLTASFNLADRDQGDESQTNMHEQFRVLSTVVAIMKEAIVDILDSGFKVESLYIPPKGDSPDGKSEIDSKRGRFYMAYIKKSLKTLPGDWSVIKRRYEGQTYYEVSQNVWSGSNVVYTTEASLNEESYNDYPAAAKANAKKALEWRDEYGRDEVDAGTPVGWARANQLASGENLSAETVKRMAAFNRHRKNSKISAEHKDTPWKDRGYVAWLIWGGDEGVDWAIKKSKEIDAMKEQIYNNMEQFNNLEENKGIVKKYSEFVNEATDINDPVLMAMRAKRAELDKRANAERQMAERDIKKVYAKLEKLNKELNGLYLDRQRLLFDMEQEAEMEGGPISDEYGSRLDSVEASIAKLVNMRRDLEKRLI